MLVALEALRHFLSLLALILLKLIELNYPVLRFILLLFFLLIVGLLSSPSILWGFRSCSPFIRFNNYVVGNALSLHIRFNTLLWIAKILFRVSIPAVGSTLTGTICYLWSSAHLDFVHASIADFYLITRRNLFSQSLLQWWFRFLIYIDELPIDLF